MQHKLKHDLVIDDNGALWRAGIPVYDPDTNRGWHRSGSTSQIGGGRIEIWHYRTVELRCHFDSDGRIWWSAPGALCTPRDIDEARRVRKEIEARQSAGQDQR